MEYMPGGSVRVMLDRFGTFGDGIVKLYTVQLMQGLAFLHKNGIAHRDIKVLASPTPFSVCGWKPQMVAEVLSKRGVERTHSRFNKVVLPLWCLPASTRNPPSVGLKPDQPPESRM